MTPFSHVLIARSLFSVIRSVFGTAKPATFCTQIMGTKRIGDYSEVTSKMTDFAAVLEEETGSECFSEKQKLSNNFKPTFRSF